ncbi:hypothetical protein AB0B66_10365 [Catellatospora sp. NPDC049111]|uniref:hypothetical protein n=1 Tax=Catellatospora sp. NPDC049111 TaxID=3155271 RepID=UPI0033D8ED8E
MTHPIEPDDTDRRAAHDVADGTVLCVFCSQPTIANNAHLLAQGWTCNLCIARAGAVTR